MSKAQKTLNRYKRMISQHSKPVNMKWVEEALKILATTAERTLKTTVKQRKRIRRLPKLEQVILEIGTTGTFSPTNRHLQEALGISSRTAQRYTRMLCRLRWLIKGRWYMWWDLNPFLELMIMLYPKKIRQIVSKFVSQQVDLLDLFALPLQLALNDKVWNVEMVWSQHQPDWNKYYFPEQGYHVKLYPYWNGIIQFKVETDKKTHYAVLPYNIHWTGRNCHITLPIPFTFYGIESAAYSKSKVKIHFDNSIKTAIPLGSASYTTRRLLHKYGLEHWSDSVTRFMIKYWKNEYAECFDFKTHEQVLRDRLINKNIPIKQMVVSSNRRLMKIDETSPDWKHLRRSGYIRRNVS